LDALQTKALSIFSQFLNWVFLEKMLEKKQKKKGRERLARKLKITNICLNS